MDLRALEYAVTLADELHFGRAARRHFISEQPFGRRIRELEATLGVRLFERTSRQVSLTDAGADVVARARRILADVETISRLDPTRRPCRDAGTLRLGVLGFGAGALWPALREKLLRHAPDTEIEFVELDFSNQHSLLRDGEVDAAIVQYFEPQPGTQFDVIDSVPRVVVVPARSRLAKRRHLAAADLRSQDWLRVSNEHGTIAKWAGIIPPDVPDEFVVNRPEAIPTAVAMTGRISLHAATARDYYGNPDVAFVPVDGPPLQIAVASQTNDRRVRARALRQAAREVAADTPNPAM